MKKWGKFKKKSVSVWQSKAPSVATMENGTRDYSLKISTKLYIKQHYYY